MSTGESLAQVIQFFDNSPGFLSVTGWFRVVANISPADVVSCYFYITCVAYDGAGNEITRDIETISYASTLVLGDNGWQFAKGLLFSTPGTSRNGLFFEVVCPGGLQDGSLDIYVDDVKAYFLP